MKRVIIFASGAGSNAENIINYFQDSREICVVKVLCNKKDAGVFKRCIKLNKNCEWFSREDFLKKNTILKTLIKQTDFIVLAGFLWKIPQPIVKAFPNKIINIHPALLPKYGGKGMYGMHVHEAVKRNGDKKSGITIHYVNEHYDEGAIIVQTETKIEITDSPKDIAQKIHDLEYEYFPKINEKTVINIKYEIKIPPTEILLCFAKNPVKPIGLSFFHKNKISSKLTSQLT